jgi:hypothetical protein
MSSDRRQDFQDGGNDNLSITARSSAVIARHSRPKDGVASLAYDRAIP